MYTEIHRILGRPVGPITSEMLDVLIEQNVTETRGLDFKKGLVPKEELGKSDFLKDIAAMANSGGGVLIYGIDQTEEGSAGKRFDVSQQFDESYERTYVSLAKTRIHPPVLGMEVIAVGDGGPLAVVVVIPESTGSPHLISDKEKNSGFRVPVRIGRNTTFLDEPEIARLYRDRFDRDRNALEKLNELFEMSREIVGDSSIWFIGVAIPHAHPRIQIPDERQAMAIGFGARDSKIRRDLYGEAPTPLLAVDQRPRRGFRSWVFSAEYGGVDPLRLVSLHDDGSVRAIGSLPAIGEEDGKNHVVGGMTLEAYVSDLVLTAQMMSERTGNGEYDFLLRLGWFGKDEIEIYYRTHIDYFSEETVAVKSFIPVYQTVNVLGDEENFKKITRGLILDCVNQFGVNRSRLFPLK